MNNKAQHEDSLEDKTDHVAASELSRPMTYDKAQAERQQHEHELKKLAAERGKIGNLIGGLQHAPMYIMGIVILLITCILGLTVVFLPDYRSVAFEIMRVMIYGSMGFFAAATAPRARSSGPSGLGG